MPKRIQIKWLNKPETQDYPAAISYLSLIYDKSAVRGDLKRLGRAPLTSFKAKDILRASGLRLLKASNYHVRKDAQKIAAGQKLSPLLLVRDPGHGKVIIADGFHRLCAAYLHDEDADIPCRIV